MVPLGMAKDGMGVCWQKSVRGLDPWLTLELDPGGQRLLPAPLLALDWAQLPPITSHAALREQRGVEIIGRVYEGSP